LEASGNQESEPILWLVLALLGNGILCVMLVVAAVLRETPEFWLNAGGYPVMLRGCVRWLFLPCMLACLSGVAGGAWALIRISCNKQKTGGLALLLLFFQVGLVLIAMAIMLWDNVVDLI
jgi:hypothetical protein